MIIDTSDWPEILQSLSWLALFVWALVMLAAALVASFIFGPPLAMVMRAFATDYPNVVDAIDMFIAIMRIFIYTALGLFVFLFFIADITDLVALDGVFGLSFLQTWIIFGALWLATEIVRAVIYGFDLSQMKNLYRSFLPNQGNQ